MQSLCGTINDTLQEDVPADNCNNSTEVNDFVFDNKDNVVHSNMDIKTISEITKCTFICDLLQERPFAQILRRRSKRRSIGSNFRRLPDEVQRCHRFIPSMSNKSNIPNPHEISCSSSEEDDAESRICFYFKSNLKLMN